MDKEITNNGRNRRGQARLRFSELLAGGVRLVNRHQKNNKGKLMRKNRDGSWTIEVTSKWTIKRTTADIEADWKIESAS